ncbi:M48 family metallopeptidase [Solemya velum gill symbiont]|uniref:Peptidase M48 n=1 Tax=Solemya velum gill symbiont TaxID=2340 RepID=A0A0B0H818_SOVGS|nr:M48 family metallopeptidase [Solemya velum gill symbiont]KHF24787.1 Zn-dependent protease with chaperone function [Solemya velum gill symbiont]OOY33944.1 peptidase M48 [Solemya velum gill symbiont]OOY36598.1 peptidase M48 [Solemya velum gill symbiont]OOY39198.1 peptidase M48 [Solemya velum gill symbiont]OOY43338.1 peptidase M48 [Solemya velum gill symbiont]
MNEFSYLFLLFLFLTTATQLWLSWRQQAHVAAHRPKVPEAFSGMLSLEQHHKAADYTITKVRFGRLELFLGLALLLILTLGGGLNWADKQLVALGHSELVTGTLVIVAVTLFSSIVSIPAALYSTFVIEERFGFNNSTMATFWLDRLKGLVLSLLIGVPLVMAVLWVMQSLGEYWWITAWVALTAFSLLITWIYPQIIAPLFNSFEPLEEGEVAERVKSLLSRTGFQSNGVYVMDGSRRSGHGNAYFTGFGNNKRIVFFDTLLKQLSAEQVEAVLAHELGHFKKRHIIKGFILSAAMSLAGFAILAWLMKNAWFYTGLGVEQSSTYMALILFVLISPAFTYFLSPALSWVSRKHEFEADAFAANQSGGRHLVSALITLYRENASTLTPDALHSLFYDSHPPASIRIRHLEEIDHGAA